MPPPTTAIDRTGAVWTGYLRITSCASREGCAGWAGILFPFTLTISGTSIEAKLEGETPERYVVVMPGTIQPDGTHIFSGGRSADGRMEVRELRIVKDRDAVITGTIEYTANANRSDPRAISATIPSATLQRDLRNPGAGGSPTLAGTWYGSGRTDTCQGFSCGNVGTPGSFSITIQESATGVTALLDSDIWARRVVTLGGVRQPDNSVRFAGTWESDDPSRTGEFRHFTVRPDPALGLTGTFEWVDVTQFGTNTRFGVILSASRYVVLRSPGAFQGAWRGDYVPRTCSGDCSVVRIGQPSTLTLTLTQAGATVSGSVNPAAPRSVAVQGTASGSSLAVEGESIVDVCLYDWEGPVVCTQRIRGLVVQVDSFGRMSGTFELFREGWQGSTHYRCTITAELRNVIRRLQ